MYTYKVLKEEIKIYLKTHKGDTEKIIILKALKLMGFNIPNEREACIVWGGVLF